MSYNDQQYGNFYDPVGSQSNKQPTGYTYRASTTTASQYPSTASANYQSGGYQYGSTYGTQQYAPSTQSASNTSQAATALSSMSTAYNQPSSSSRTSQSHNNGYDQSSWGSANYNAYNPSTMQPPNRTQSNNSPLYPTSSSSSNLGRTNMPEQGQSSSNTYAQQTYQNARASATPANQQYQASYTGQPGQQPQTQSQQPQRYASPLHAVQAHQQGHGAQHSRSSAHHPSPQMASQQVQGNNRQHSASVEPAATTVNPSQVYDDRAERQRKAQIEAEKRRKREADEAARKAEEDRIAAEKRKEEEDRQAEEDQRKADAEAAKKKAADRKVQQRTQKRAEKRESKTAATALQQMASSSRVPATESEAPPVFDEESEMRAMFKKMREFNSKNPAMLAKMWEEERKAHAPQSPQQPKAGPAATLAQASSSAMPPPAQNRAASQQQFRPFQKPLPPPKQTSTAQNVATSNQPVATQSNTSLWPPQKKGALAEAAGAWLRSLPENRGKNVGADVIMKILGENPSYVQLCEALEAHGYRFERSLLARELLKAVPDGIKASAQSSRSTPLGQVNATAPQVNGGEEVPKKRGPGRPPKDKSATKERQSSFNQGPVAYGVPSFAPLADAAREVNSMNDVPTPHMQGGPVQPPSWANPYFDNESQSAAQNGSRAPSQSQPPEQKPEKKPEEPRKPPVNKEEAARKTFGDLVDLTAEDSDDDGPPKKVLQTTNGQMNGVSFQPPAPPIEKPKPGFKSFQQPMTFGDFYRPGQPPPGAAVGLGNFPSVPQAQKAPPLQPSSTQQPPAVLRPSGPSEERKQHERIKGKMLVEPIMRDRVARRSKYDSRTIARDVLLATGRHPDMRALNAHLNGMQKLLSTHGGGYETEGGRGDRSDLSTIRWDIIDPEPEMKAEAKNSVVANAGAYDMAADADDEDDNTPVAPPRVVRQTVENGDGTVSHVAVANQISSKPSKRRGRPPRASLPAAQTLSTPLRQLTGIAPNTAPGRSAATAGPPAANMSGDRPVGYSAFRQTTTDADGNIVKKKGRPVGWRKSIHSRAAQGLAPGSGTQSNQPSKLRQSQKPRAEVEPKYQVWKCRWQDCSAELHNLETLKKHVVKLHGKANANGVFECLWEGCIYSNNHCGKGKHQATPVNLGQINEWLSHVDKKHLEPVAWELGDGPRGGLSG